MLEHSDKNVISLEMTDVIYPVLKGSGFVKRSG